MDEKDKLISVKHLKWNVGGILCGMLSVDYLNWILDNEEPAVDAIPIEWLKCKRYEHNNDGFGWIYDAVMDDWRKEGSTQVDHD